MGLRENFTQALRELSGTTPAKEPSLEKDVKAASVKASQVEDLRRKVESDMAEITSELAAGESFSAPYIPAPVVQDTAAVFPQNLHVSPGANMQNANVINSRAATDEMSTAPIYPTQQTLQPQNLPRSTPQPNGGSTYATNAFGDVLPEQTSQPAHSNIPPLTSSIPPITQNTASSPPPPPPLSTGIPQAGSMPLAPLGDIGSDGLDSEITVISKNTVVEGNIRSFANMNIDGNVRGDIETTKNVDLNGKIVGNLTCNNAQMLTSQIQGNVRMKGNIIMGRDTLLIGDLISTYAKVNGKVKGNLEVGGKAELKGDAVIFGDISASTITVDDGAIIQGYVSTTFLNKEESRNIFPEAISIGEQA
ncbi:MAG: polymer-forming cytoskeletal protein [Oscillospiraceae bacterium]|nr:polymer-forming cytoskeletal protein [Oscillospiraceae bacterium]